MSKEKEHREGGDHRKIAVVGRGDFLLGRRFFEFRSERGKYLGEDGRRKNENRIVSRRSFNCFSRRGATHSVMFWETAP